MSKEIVIDLFAGGGGASTGMEQALKGPVDVAVNHDRIAIEVHRLNHPQTEHWCADLWSVPPNWAVKGRPVGLLWASPDCTHHSKAKGGPPVRDSKKRDMAWIVERWAQDVKPRVIILENVEEFLGWGPCDSKGRVIKSQKGSTFRAFVARLRRQGYSVQYRELRACDYGAPTSRKRLFLIARRDKRPIVWPEPTHGPEAGRPYRAASECLDFSLPCPSIFLSKEEGKRLGVRRPLAENTLKRIAKGIQRYVIDAPEPFIVTCNHGGEGFRGQGLSDPMKTVTSSRDAHGLVMPHLISYYGRDGFRGQGSDESLRTVSTENRFGLVASNLLQLKNNCHGRSCLDPIPTLTAGGSHIGEVRSFLIKYYGQGVGQTLQEPLGTLTGRDRFGVVTVHGQDYVIADIGLRMLQPRELFLAQGFPPEYRLDGVNKTAQVRLCGNSVPPQFAAALTRANYKRENRKSAYSRSPIMKCMERAAV